MLIRTWIILLRMVTIKLLRLWFHCLAQAGVGHMPVAFVWKFQWSRRLFGNKTAWSASVDAHQHQLSRLVQGSARRCNCTPLQRKPCVSPPILEGLAFRKHLCFDKRAKMRPGPRLALVFGGGGQERLRGLMLPLQGAPARFI